MGLQIWFFVAEQKTSFLINNSYYLKKDIHKFREDNELEEEIIFQQDNAACHTSYESKTAIKIL